MNLKPATQTKLYGLKKIFNVDLKPTKKNLIKIQKKQINFNG